MKYGDIYGGPPLEASKPKLVNPVLDGIGVNSLRLGGLHIVIQLEKYFIIFRDLQSKVV